MKVGFAPQGQDLTGNTSWTDSARTTTKQHHLKQPHHSCHKKGDDVKPSPTPAYEPVAPARPRQLPQGTHVVLWPLPK